jgi:DNA-binding transcriptional ArsR family regulator
MERKKREARSPTPIPDHEFVKKETFHKALACRTRLKILAMLEQKSMFGYELVRHLGIGQSTVSYHLGILRKVGLITTQQRAEGRLYSLVRADRVA